MLSVNHPHSLHSANKMWVSLKWCSWLTSFPLRFRAAALTCLAILYSKPRLSSTVKAAYWLLSLIEKLLAGHEKYIQTSHKAVHKWTVNLIGWSSVPNQQCYFLQLLSIVTFMCVYFNSPLQCWCIKPVALKLLSVYSQEGFKLSTSSSIVGGVYVVQQSCIMFASGSSRGGNEKLDPRKVWG